MKEKIGWIFLSFILEIIVSILFRSDSYFQTLFVFLNTLYLSFTIKNVKKSLLFCFVIGLFYDMIITNTWFLNAALFPLISGIARYVESYIYKNQLTFLFSFFGYIIFYRLLTYLIFLLIGYRTFSSFLLFKSIISSIFLNFFMLIISQKIFKPYNSL